MSKLWVGGTMYVVDEEVRDHVDTLEQQLADKNAAIKIFQATANALNERCADKDKEIARLGEAVDKLHVAIEIRDYEIRRTSATKIANELQQALAGGKEQDK